MKKIFSVAIIGCGSRGANAYGRQMFKEKDKFRVVALCDIVESALKTAATELEIENENCFTSEDAFFAKKRADVLVIATQDRDHVWMCVKGMQLGYDVLLEKPISPEKEELYALLEAQKKYNKKVLVCHVLRYAPAFVKIKEFLDSGAIGKLVRMEAVENVAYWHQAHSFVRGNWRREQDTSPMIMQKCCHDLDLIQYYVGSRCESVYSVGELSFFNRENQPDGAADRCADCEYILTCPYSAERLYVQRFKANSCSQSWPYDVVDSSRPITEKSLRAAYEKGPYGRCVFACDNDVVDNQTVDMYFENGVKATLTMTAFTYYQGRRYVFHGTYGELELDEQTHTIRLSVYGRENEIFDTREIIKQYMQDNFGHGGGDYCLVQSFYKVLSEETPIQTGLEASIESHLIAVAAEQSRKNGEIVKVHG